MTAKKEPETTTTLLERQVASDISKLFLIKAKKHWLVTLAVIGLGWNPVKDIVSTQFPVRGEAKQNAYRVNTESDNRVILSDLSVLSNNQVEFQLKVTDQFNRIDKHLDKIDDRFDRFLEMRNPDHSSMFSITNLDTMTKEN